MRLGIREMGMRLGIPGDGYEARDTRSWDDTKGTGRWGTRLGILGGGG